MPLVSVLLCTKNPNPTRLHEAILSVCRQQYPRWELILYDDASDNHGQAATQSAASLDARIRLVRGSVSRGLAHALNCAVQSAKGAYLARMDDDDRCAPERFLHQMAFLSAHPEYDWVGSFAKRFDDMGVWGDFTVPITPTAHDFLHNSPFIHPSVMFRAQSLARVGGYNESETCRFCEDYELFLRMAAMGMRGVNLPLPLLFYREDRASYQKRTVKRRFSEAAVRFRGFSALRLPFMKRLLYTAKPLALCLVPRGVQYAVKRRLARSSHTKGDLP